MKNWNICPNVERKADWVYLSWTSKNRFQDKLIILPNELTFVHLLDIFSLLYSCIYLMKMKSFWYVLSYVIHYYCIYSMWYGRCLVLIKLIYNYKVIIDCLIINSIWLFSWCNNSPLVWDWIYIWHHYEKRLDWNAWARRLGLLLFWLCKFWSRCARILCVVFRLSNNRPRGVYTLYYYSVTVKEM